jgi:hypothetical protein
LMLPTLKQETQHQFKKKKQTRTYKVRIKGKIYV